MNGRENQDELLARVGRLPREIPPGKDLWPEIRARIEEDQTRVRSRPGGWNAWVPAALAASVVVAVAMVALLRHPEPGGPETAAAPEGIPLAATPASFGPSYTLGEKYQAAREGLVRDLDAHLDELPPETREVVKGNLEAIHKAVGEINAALDQDPGNIFLQQLLLDSYHDELAVLVNVRRMTESISKSQRNEI